MIWDSTTKAATPTKVATFDPKRAPKRKSTTNYKMNNIDQRRIKNDQHRALAIEADHTVIANSNVLKQFIGFVMMLVRLLNHINLNATQTSKPHHKLKMQLLVIYSIPAFFIFGASAIVLIVMYLCIFELVLHLAKKTIVSTI